MMGGVRIYIIGGGRRGRGCRVRVRRMSLDFPVTVPSALTTLPLTFGRATGFDFAFARLYLVLAIFDCAHRD